MRFVIITGLSGSGKTNTLKCMEDMGFFCVDNLPPVLIPKFAELSQSSPNMERVAVVVDMRGGELFNAIDESLQLLDELGIHYDILYLEADDNTLVRRYNESRRAHPLSSDGRVLDGIKKEKSLLSGIRMRATKIIDTTDMKIQKLRDILNKEYGYNRLDRITISIISFGYKRGVPSDTDIVFDVRFLPNPFYISALRKLTGKDEKVKEYLFSFPETEIFINKFLDIIEYILPYYCKEAKTELVIAIGCTGGMHRSVVVAESLYKRLQSEGRRVFIDHRDMENEKMGIKYHPID